MSLHPHLDPELEEVAEEILAVDLSGVTVEDIPELRAQLDEMVAALRGVISTNDRVVSEDRMVPGLTGAPDVRIRIYRPADQAGILPCFYHIHGGGMIMGSRIHGGGMIMGSVDTEDSQMALIVEKVGCVVVSVDYRLAPENPHPAPVEDCYAGLVWAAENADELRIDPNRIGIGGESAGGGLAAATTLLVRDRGGPQLVFQYLVYPMLDDRNQTPSSVEFAGRWPGWPREMNLVGWQALLGDAVAGGDVSPYAAPARAEDLSGLPPAYIDVGGLEVFRDEDIDYAHRLMLAGVPVELHVYPGVFHGWDLFAPDAAVTQQATRTRLRALARALNEVSVKAQ